MRHQQQIERQQRRLTALKKKHSKAREDAVQCRLTGGLRDKKRHGLMTNLRQQVGDLQTQLANQQLKARKATAALEVAQAQLQQRLADQQCKERATAEALDGETDVLQVATEAMAALASMEVTQAQLHQQVELLQKQLKQSQQGVAGYCFAVGVAAIIVFLVVVVAASLWLGA
jgi:hypothetical protein